MCLLFVRRSLILLVTIVACTTDREPAPSPPRVVPGTLRGTVMMTLVPGAADADRDPKPQPAACEIVVTPKDGVPPRTRSTDAGMYELSLAPGAYIVGAVQCGDECDPRGREIQIGSGVITRVDFHCQRFGK